MKFEPHPAVLSNLVGARFRLRPAAAGLRRDKPARSLKSRCEWPFANRFFHRFNSEFQGPAGAGSLPRSGLNALARVLDGVWSEEIRSPRRLVDGLRSKEAICYRVAVALLDQKRLVVMGGTSGLGLSAARALVREGARLVVVGHLEEDVARAGEVLGASARVLLGDATEPAVSERAIVDCVDRYGGLDGLYHVAGGSGRRFGDGPLDLVSDEGWDQTVRLNLTTVGWSNRAALRQFLRQGQGGSIVNLSSVVAYRPSPGHFATHAYAAAKAGIIGLSLSLAASYAAQNIRVNVIAPGLTDTPMARRAAQDPVIQSFIRTKQPLDGGRIAVPEDLDGLVVFLMSDGAKFITGQVIGVDGGWSVTEGQYGQ